MTGRSILVIAGVLLLGPSIGCTLAPKSFVQSNDPAPLVRARALGLGHSQPDSSVVPALIAKLNDPDAVVRLAAIEELKRRTGQDLGYAPWEDEAGRANSVMAWNNWWQSRQNGVMPSSQLASRRPVIGSQQPSPQSQAPVRRRWGFNRGASRTLNR